MTARTLGSGRRGRRSNGAHREPQGLQTSSSRCQGLCRADQTRSARFGRLPAAIWLTVDHDSTSRSVLRSRLQRNGRSALAPGSARRLRWLGSPCVAAARIAATSAARPRQRSALAHTTLLLAAAVTVWSLGELAQWPVAAYTTSLAPPGMTGRYAGARSLCYGLALLLAPLAGTALYNLSPAALWGACAAAGICAAAVITPATRQH